MNRKSQVADFGCACCLPQQDKIDFRSLKERMALNDAFNLREAPLPGGTISVPRPGNAHAIAHSSSYAGLSLQRVSLSPLRKQTSL
jgi:hypothetical protein